MMGDAAIVQRCEVLTSLCRFARRLFGFQHPRHRLGCLRHVDASLKVADVRIAGTLLLAVSLGREEHR
jgi:hypothetical protein